MNAFDGTAFDSNAFDVGAALPIHQFSYPRLDSIGMDSLYKHPLGRNIIATIPRNLPVTTGDYRGGDWPKRKCP